MYGFQYNQVFLESVNRWRNYVHFNFINHNISAQFLWHFCKHPKMLYISCKPTKYKQTPSAKYIIFVHFVQNETKWHYIAVRHCSCYVPWSSFTNTCQITEIEAIFAANSSTCRRQRIAWSVIVLYDSLKAILLVVTSV